jgi:hypothetical protein
MRVFDIKLRKWIQVPVLLTFAYFDKNNIITFYSLINIKTIATKGIEVAVKDLLIDFFIQIKNNQLNGYTIFMHNLGKFDGFYFNFRIC